MAAPSIEREAALRIGLASKVLPGVDARRLLATLVERLGEPLTEQRLTKITVTDLKTGLSSLDGEEDGEDADIGMWACQFRFEFCNVGKQCRCFLVLSILHKADSLFEFFLHYLK